MDHLQQLTQSVRLGLLGMIVLTNVILVASWVVTTQLLGLATLPAIAVSVAVTLASALIISTIASRYLLQPIRVLWQAILHLSPSVHGTSAPDLDKVRLGRDMLMNLTTQLYQVANVADQAAQEAKAENANVSHNFVAQNLPLPLVLIDENQTITFLNEAAEKYIGFAGKDVVGKNVYMVLDMSFPSADTFDNWLRDVKTKNATATNSWERVRLNVRDNHPARLFDLAAYYNRDNPQKIETMLVMFDHTKQYSQDDQAISFMALSVHELRTPLTLLRGYIDVFEDEFEGKLDSELASFMQKMSSQADQLMAFVGNILNVARVDGDQLELRLAEERWDNILKAAIQNMSLRAKVRGITLHCRLATDLPTVGVDPISIQEVISNLVDNAIKYSGTSKTIDIESKLNDEGMVETTITDYGLGISSSIMPNLFTKFYRDHRNRAQIGGTGLGLYLSKAIITAHGGNVWVRSKEGQGSTFGFTLMPYAKLTAEMKRDGNNDLVRSAHGWIKNHSLYRQ